MIPQIVARHREVLADMSPQERAMQARYQMGHDPFGPALAPVGSDLGIPLVKPGTDWIHPALPRSAVQLVVVEFQYSGEFHPDNPA